MFIKNIKQRRIYYVYNSKVNNLLRKNASKPLSKAYKKEIREKYLKYDFKSISTKWHQYYSSVYNENLADFVPESLFYTVIESSLNSTIMYPALEDKNLLDKFFPVSFLPEVIVKNINGYFYANDVQISMDTAIDRCLAIKEFVIKPSAGTAGGTGVKKVDLNSHSVGSDYLYKLFLEYGQDYVIQKILKQHVRLSELNPSSVNTVRVISYMRPKEVNVLSAVVRVGRLGSFTDNRSLGGFSCGIDENGKLKEYGRDNYGAKYSKSDSGIELKNFQIPLYDKIIEIIKVKHRNLPYFKLVSWDIMVTDNNEVKMIEFNAVGQDIDMHQISNGPLFGEFFNEIMEITKNHDPMNDFMKYGK